MTDAELSQGETDAKAARAARKAEAKAEERRVAEQLSTRRIGQLEQVQAAIQELEKRLETELSNARTHAELTSHLDGFYEEIDKLTKGKAMLEVTHLVVETTNNIIRDAKTIIVDDAYMARVKEFVPAGNNPVYPDVLVTLRTVRQAVSRYGAGRTDRGKLISSRLAEGRTIAAALSCHLDGIEWPSKEEVESKIDSGNAWAPWFFENENGEEYFDFERLDRQRDLGSHLLKGIDGR